MMGVLETILPAVARSSSVSLEIYRVLALSPNEAARDLIKSARAVNNFASILKQIGTIIKEDDRLPSNQAIETLEDLIDQSQAISSEIESTTAFLADECYGNDSSRAYSHGPMQLGSSRATRLVYLTSHLEALKATLAVLLQTLYTAQSIIWSKYRPTITHQQAERAVANEKLQLQTLITEQQVSILEATIAYERIPSGNLSLLMDTESSQSIVAAGRDEAPSPAALYRYQNQHVSSLDKTSSNTSNWLIAIRSITSLQIDHLLDRWTCLPQLDAQLRETEKQSRTHQRQSQQPMVESDDEDDHGLSHKLAKNDNSTMQPLFAEEDSPPNQSQDAKFGPNAPISPAASRPNSRHSLASFVGEQESPRSSMSSIPVEAAAAIEAKEEDEDIDLEIPWRLCTRKYYWKYVDSKMTRSNTDQLPSVAFLERNSWTEIMASWVCKEAIREAGFRFTQVQKERKDGRRTHFETCFCIEQPLQFEQVKRLVERTVDMYRQKKPQSPPPRIRRSSFDRQPAPPPKINRPKEIDRDRTPVPSKTHPSLGRTTSSMPIPPLMPPPLDRSLSMPGPGFQNGPIPRSSNVNLHIPMPPAPYSNSMPHGPYSPQPQPQQLQQQQQAPPYSPHLYTSPQAPPNQAFPNQALPPHLQPHNYGMSQSPLRQAYRNPESRHKYDNDEVTASDSDAGKERRRRRSKERSRYSTTEAKRKSHNKSKAAGVLMGVGGLTALLDGLSGL